MSWQVHIINVTRNASYRLCFLYRCKRYHFPDNHIIYSPPSRVQLPFMCIYRRAFNEIQELLFPFMDQSSVVGLALYNPTSFKSIVNRYIRWSLFPFYPNQSLTAWCSWLARDVKAVHHSMFICHCLIWLYPIFALIRLGVEAPIEKYKEDKNSYHYNNIRAVHKNFYFI